MKPRNLLASFVLAVTVTGIAPSAVLAQPAPAERDFTSRAEMERMILSIGPECEAPSRILAEVRLRKIRKAYAAQNRELTSKYAQAIFTLSKQQCISVQVVQILRAAKSLIKSDAATELGLDDEIEKHLSLIEKTL